MKNVIAILFVVVLVQSVFGQRKDSIPDISKGNYIITNLEKDTTKLRDKASQTLRALKNGAVIIRLKTNLKSVDAYRKAGQNDIADRIENDRKKQNEKIFWAFTENFIFCDVYFIYANETEAFLKGNRKLFLNQQLNHDTSITFTGDNFVFCEYGSVESFSDFHDRPLHPVLETGASMSGSVDGRKIFDTIPTQTSTSPATTSGLFFSDKDLRQLQRPFPFVQGVYMENYNAPVKMLNMEMFRAYNRLVVNRDFKEKVKAEKRKARAEHKKSPAYNPFK